MLKKKCKYFFHLESICGTKPNVTLVAPIESYTFEKQPEHWQQIDNETLENDAEPGEGTSGVRSKSRSPIQKQNPSKPMPRPQTQTQKHVPDDCDEELVILPLLKMLKPAVPKHRGKGKNGNDH